MSLKTEPVKDTLRGEMRQAVRLRKTANRELQVDLVGVSRGSSASGMIRAAALGNNPKQVALRIPNHASNSEMPVVLGRTSVIHLSEEVK